MRSAGPALVRLVDDDAFIRRPLQVILREEGYEAVTARDGVDSSSTSFQS